MYVYITVYLYKSFYRVYEKIQIATKYCMYKKKGDL